jgi:hypothetical protein
MMAARYKKLHILLCKDCDVSRKTREGLPLLTVETGLYEWGLKEDK